MKNKIKPIAIVACLLAAQIASAQKAYDFKKADCNGNMHSLYSDLDSGKAVVLFFYMPSCGSCPPEAKKIQTMAININAKYPGSVKAYAFPFQNSTTCSYSKSWTASNNLAFYAPMDSGAYQVAYYGGFGMPTVVLLGGKNHRTMFSTLSFSSKDTILMKDSIFRLMGVSAVKNLQNIPKKFICQPNPASSNLSITVEPNQRSTAQIELTDLAGKKIFSSATKVSSIAFSESIDISMVPNGVYIVHLNLNGTITSQKIIITRQ